jgi:ribosomal protein L31E
VAFLIFCRIELKSKSIKDDLDTISSKNEIQNVQSKIRIEVEKLEDELKNVVTVHLMKTGITPQLVIASHR